MDAEDLTFPNEQFDIVFCGFSIFFMPDVNRALFEFKRVLKRQGRLALSVWGKCSPLTQWIVERAKKYGAVKQLKTCSIDTPSILKEILKNAGFKDIDICEDNQSFCHDNAEEWWNSLWSHAVRAYLEQLSPNDLNAFHQEALKHISEIYGNSRIQEPMHAIYAICKKG